MCAYYRVVNTNPVGMTQFLPGKSVVCVTAVRAVLIFSSAFSTEVALTVGLGAVACRPSAFH